VVLGNYAQQAAASKSLTTKRLSGQKKKRKKVTLPRFLKEGTSFRTPGRGLPCTTGAIKSIVDLIIKIIEGG